MTSARIVTPGRAMAMIPTITARMPSTISWVDVDFHMTCIPSLQGLRMKLPGTARSGTRFLGNWPTRSPVRSGCSRRSAGDIELVVDFEDAVGHPGGTDHRVALRPGGDVPGKRHRVPPGVDRDVAVIGDHRIAVQRALDNLGDADRVCGVGDLDVVLDVADTGQPGNSHFSSGALWAVAHGAGELEVAVVSGRLDAVRHRDVQ